jgi:hypothetical protein
MASHSIPDLIDMNSNAKTWLQLYVDAMTEKDPYKRLALVQELRKMPRHDDSDDMAPEPVIRLSKRARVTRRRH